MANLENNSIWPDVEERIVDLIEAHNSSIVFANSRRLAERLTARLNEIHAERTGVELGGPNPGVAGGAPAHLMGSGQTYGAEPLLARAHHGSVSKEPRAEVEDALKSGRLKAVVATSSLELGIDMGAVDLVIQVETPPSVASGLQRIGRAGHQVGEISQGVLFPKHRTDLIGCAVSVQRMLAGQIETMRVPANPLDVLAQHTVAACALEPLDADPGSTPCGAAHRSRRCRAAPSRRRWTCSRASTRRPSSPNCGKVANGALRRTVSNQDSAFDQLQRAGRHGVLGKHVEGVGRHPHRLDLSTEHPLHADRAPDQVGAVLGERHALVIRPTWWPAGRCAGARWPPTADDQIDRTHVDTEFQARRRDDRLEPPALERARRRRAPPC